MNMLSHKASTLTFYVLFFNETLIFVFAFFSQIILPEFVFVYAIIFIVISIAIDFQKIIVNFCLINLY
jgi:hypothetical protein